MKSMPNENENTSFSLVYYIIALLAYSIRGRLMDTRIPKSTM
jgi:hypothetical protein